VEVFLLKIPAMKVYNTTIETFLSDRKLAIAGASRNKQKFGYAVLRDLKEKGYELYPVHPEADKIDGVDCYRSFADIPRDVTHLVSLVPKDKTLSVVSDALDHGITGIWLQQTTDTPEAIDLIMEKQAGLVMKACVLMYAAPVKGIHKFHRGIMKLFGLFSK